MRFTRRILAWSLALAMVGQGVAQAATYYYFRGGAATEASGTKPASPAPQGTFAILVDAPEIGIRGSGYSATTYAYSNIGPVVFSVSSGNLPPGIVINASTGTISGTPSSVGVSNVVIQGADTSTGNIATATLTIEVNDPFSISGNPGALVQKDTPYSADFTLDGGGQPYGFSVGSLPPGLTFTSGGLTGTISGVPTTAGSYNIMVTGSDKHGLMAQYPYTLQVYDTLTIAGAPPATATVGTPYSGQLTVTGGAAPFTYTIAAGSLPTGVTLKSTGVISGTPLAAGVKSGIRVKVSDATGQTAISSSFNIAVAATGSQPLMISVMPATTGRENKAYATQYTAGGGSGSYSFSMVGGALPQGLSFNARSGLISGAPLNGTAGTYPDITAKVVDSATQESVSTPFTLTIAQAQIALSVTGTPPASVQVGTPYAAQFSGHGGTGAGYVFALASGTLPPGLSLSPTGMLSGTPNVIGSYTNLRIRVTDNASNTALSSAFSINVLATPPLIISGSPPAAVIAGNSYSATWTAFDGSGAGYHFTSVGGDLPPGLALSDINGAQGLLSGTATIAGTYRDLRIQVIDSLGNTATTSPFTITVESQVPQDPPLVISGSPSAAVLAVGDAYSAQFAASGGTGTGYVFSPVGPLPEGIYLDSATGALAGTATAPGAYPTLRIQVSDSNGNSATSSSFSITVLEELRLTGNPSVTAEVGESYSGQFTAGGGRPPYVFSATGLPPGLLMDQVNGALAGIPSQSGQFQVTASVSDDLGGEKSFSYSLEVLPSTTAPLTISWAPQTYWRLGDPMTVTVTVGGRGGRALGFSSTGTLPPGVSLDPSTGVLSGTVSTVGTYGPVTISVTDGTQTATTSAATFTVSDKAPLTITWNPPANPVEVGAFSLSVKATGGDSSKYVFSYNGSLPTGTTFYTSSGTICCAATDGGSFTGSVTVKDGTQTATTPTATIVINPQKPLEATLDTPIKTLTTIGANYRQYFTGKGGSISGYQWTMAPGSGPLPPGLSLSGASITGVPTQVGVYPDIRLRLTDSTNNVADTTAYTITVNNPEPLTIAWSNPKTSIYIREYADMKTTVSGGLSSRYSYSLSGDLAPGTSFSSAGYVYGYTNATGTYGPFVVTVTDGVSTASTPPIMLTVKEMEITANFTGAVVGINWFGYLRTNGGGGSNKYACTGDMPPGITLSSSGSFSGIPTTPGYYPLTCSSTDYYGRVASIATSITVVANLPEPKGPTPVPEGSVGVPYSIQMTTTGGQGPYRYTGLNGVLPPGLTLDPDTGVISGVPTTKGRYIVWITVTDALGLSSTSRTIEISIFQEDVLSISGDITEDFILGQSPWQSRDPKNAQFSGTASGGNGTYSWSLAGLTQQQIDDSGFLFWNGNWGAPKKAQVLGPFYVQVRDSEYNRGRKGPYTVTVYPDLKIQQTSPPNATVGEFYSYQVEVSGGKGPLACRVWSLRMPTGLAFEPGTCVISGMTTQPEGGLNSGYEVVDASGYRTSAIWSFASVKRPTPAAPGPRPSGSLGDIDPTEWYPWSTLVPLDGAYTPVSAEISSGTLPNGLAVGVEDGKVVIRGTPYNNILPTSCGNGCQQLNPSMIDVAITISVTDAGGGQHAIAKNIRLWAYAPAISSNSGGSMVKSITSTSASNGCNGFCDVKSKLGVSGSVGLAEGESITIAFNQRVSIRHAMFTVQNSLIDAGSADYLIETTADGVTWMPWEYDWYGYDRLMPGPGHVAMHRDAYVNNNGGFTTGNLLASSTMPDAPPEFYLQGAFDHTTNYHQWGRIILGARLTRVGGAMPVLPVTNFVTGGVTYLAAAP